MAFSEFYCDFTNGSNVNAGSTEAAPVLSLTGGNWVSATGVYTKTASIANVSVGMFAAVRVDGATLAARVGRVTAVDANTVTISTTAGSGSLADQTGTASIVVGGPWKGPNAAVGFPFNFITNALTNAAGDYPRVNFKNNATYAITAAITHGNAGPIQFQGYTSTVGDGGRAIIDGGTAGASYVLLTISGANCETWDMIFQNNGATGSASGFVPGTAETNCRRVVVNNVRGDGFSATFSTGGAFIECEAYACNQSNAGSKAGFSFSGNATLVRCIAHDNAGSNTVGFRPSNGANTLIHCIADTNGSHGLDVNSVNGHTTVVGCDFYNNTGDGIRSANSAGSSIYVENCNFVKNGGYPVNRTGAGGLNGAVVNCGFGSGTQANTSGNLNNLNAVVEEGSVTYAADVTPWQDPATGNFTITMAAAKGTGRGSYTQTQTSYTGTTSAPDIGAGQASSAGGGGKFWPRRLR